MSTPAGPPLPSPRGPISESIVCALAGTRSRIPPPVVHPADPLADDDLHLALYVCYELHYQGFAGVDPNWEWEPSLLGVRRDLERRFLDELRKSVPRRDAVRPADVGALLFDLAGEGDDPSLSGYLKSRGTLEQFREFAIHRSAYQLKEADPHTWAIPRLRGGPKSALVEIQVDEYGSGSPERAHSALFAKAMEAIGLVSSYGAYLDEIPGFTLATVNLISALGLSRRHRGALVGHLAMFEISSALPNRRYAQGLRRLGFEGAALEFFDEHVEADSVHENIAAYDMAQGLARAEPELTTEIMFGAEALLLLDERFAARLLEAWRRRQVVAAPGRYAARCLIEAMGLKITYVLPVRWSQGGDLAELARYLRGMAAHVDEVIVVDGSEPVLFERHARALGEFVRHMPPHRDLSFAMGKVDGVVTGIREASHERVVIADDDVRYTAGPLERVAAALDGADLVRPQNYFDPLVWHARLDTARSLLNRVFSGDFDEPSADFPGTLAVRRSSFLAMGGYDGDALFENLELIRTVRAAGGVVESPLDLYVARRPPTTSHWASQQVRQAYDDFALPLRMAAWLLLPLIILIVAIRSRWRGISALGLAPVAVAELGRRRGGGTSVFPASAPWLAPAWILGRVACAWLAVVARCRGGAPYRQGRIALAAHGQRLLRRRYEEQPLALASAGRAEGRVPPLSASKSISL